MRVQNLLCVYQPLAVKTTPDELTPIFVTTFDDAAVAVFYTAFLKLESSPNVKIIPIIINSYGGQVYSLLAMLDILSSATKPVCTVAIGKAMSCGSVLLAAGTPGHRYVGGNADVMIHEVANGTWGKTTEIKEDVKQTARLNDLLLKKLSKFCNKTPDFFHKKLKARTNLDWYLTAKDCKSLGLADEIGTPGFFKK